MKWLPWVIVLILVGVIWKLLAVVIRHENHWYASIVGLCWEAADCSKDLDARERREKCLDRADTRTSDWWHLWYALRR
jgi:H+/Cl- antiporter ClcA